MLVGLYIGFEIGWDPLDFGDMDHQIRLRKQGVIQIIHGDQIPFLLKARHVMVGNFPDRSRSDDKAGTLVRHNLLPGQKDKMQNANFKSEISK
jgi:hypothetical protein